MKYQRPPKELQTMFEKEWRRAVKYGRPHFYGVLRPKLYVAEKGMTNRLGFHLGRNGITRFVNGRRLKSSHIIVIRLSHWRQAPLDDIINTIRHEICHVKYQHHKPTFWLLLNGLNAAPKPKYLQACIQPAPRL